MNIVAIQQMISSAARAVGTYYSNGIVVAACHALAFYVDATAKTGTPTLDVDIETSPDGVKWAKINSFTQITAVKFDSEHLADETFGKYVRMKFVVGGTGTFTFEAKMEKKEAYN